MGPVGYFLEYHNSLESSLGEQEKKLLVNTFIYIASILYIFCVCIVYAYTYKPGLAHSVYICIFIHVNCNI